MPYSLPAVDELESAARIVYRTLSPTPQYAWPLLGRRFGAEVWVKHENHTPTGAFKVRGGLVYLRELLARLPGTRGVISATRGNHGQSLGFAARHCGVPAVIVVPHGNSPGKNDAMRALGVELVEHGSDFQESRLEAARLADERGLHFVPAFHRDLVRGVATGSLELLRAVPDLETAYVPVGQGSGITAMMAARAALGRRLEIVGVVSEHAPAYALSFEAGSAVEHPVTTRLADGMACRVPDPEPLAHMLAGVARVVRVSDAEVAESMRVLFSDTHNAAEGAGAAGLAALAKEAHLVRGRKVAVILSGGNVDGDVFARVLAGDRGAV
jgi:threonine dehydratase